MKVVETFCLLTHAPKVVASRNARAIPKIAESHTATDEIHHHGRLPFGF